jgi:hypothetical protein
VQASGNNSIAAGQRSEKARRIEAGRFASALHRECTQYVETIRGLQLQREKGDRSDPLIPSILGRIYALPETQRLFGEQTYKELNVQQEQSNALLARYLRYANSRRCPRHMR